MRHMQGENRFQTASVVHYCRKANLLSGGLVATDGRMFKVAAREDRALTRKQVDRNRAEIIVSRRIKQASHSAPEAEGCVGFRLPHIVVKAIICAIHSQVESYRCCFAKNQVISDQFRHIDGFGDYFIVYR